MISHNAVIFYDKWLYKKFCHKGWMLKSCANSDDFKNVYDDRWYKTDLLLVDDLKHRNTTV